MTLLPDRPHRTSRIPIQTPLFIDQKTSSTMNHFYLFYKRTSHPEKDMSLIIKKADCVKLRILKSHRSHAQMKSINIQPEVLRLKNEPPAITGGSFRH